jgi:CheY-like chemotaxis protein
MVGGVTPLHVLLVEDEPTLQRILGVVLADAGHVTESVGTAEQALERLSAGGYSLVVTDKNLPQANGHALLAEVRRWEAEGHAPIGVLMVTGYPSRDSVLEALSRDVDGYLVKPFRSLTQAVDHVQRIATTDLRARRLSQQRARVVAEVLRGDVRSLLGRAVAVLPAAKVAADVLRRAGAIVVSPDELDSAEVVVAGSIKDLAATAAVRPGLGHVLIEAHPSQQDLVLLIGIGGGSVVDPEALTRPLP